MPFFRRGSVWIFVLLAIFFVIGILAYRQTKTARSHNQIIFTGNKGELYLINPDGSHLMPFTNANWLYDSNLPSIVYKLPRPVSNYLDHQTYHHHPDWSPDGSWIAYNSNPNRQGKYLIQNFDIYLTSVNRLKQIRLTNIPNMFVAFPSWSPDGTKLTFSAANRDDLIWHIFMINTDGTNMQQLTRNNETGSSPDWSPDNNQIVFTSHRNGNAEIYILNIGNLEQQRITHNDAGDIEPSWSPDGTQIAFTSDRDGNLEIYVMNIDGSNQTRLTSDARGNYSPTWSPNGKEIAFISERDGNPEIYVMDANGSNQKRITFTPEVNEKSPDWGP